MINKKWNSEIKSFKNIFSKDRNGPSSFDWILLFSFFTIFFVSYIYADIMVTVRAGINVWKSIENGQLFNYYSYNYKVPLAPPIYTNDASPGYDFSIYIVFAVWNLPLWILERFFHVNIFSNILCLLYMKLMLLPFLFGSAHVLRKICIKLDIEEKQAKWAVFLFLSSGFVMSSMFVMTQYDIIMIFFLLIGIYMYLKDNMKYFIVFFSIAISFKMFALFVFFPLLLLKNKRIPSLIFYSFAAVSVTILLKIPFLFDRGEKGSLLALIKHMLTSIRISIGSSDILLYPAALLFLCIFCYIKQIESPEENRKYIMYIPFLSFSLFFIISPAYPYWFILLTPFLPIILFQNEKYFKVNLLLDIFLSSSMIVFQQIFFYWCYGINVIQPMLLPKIFGSVERMKHPLNVNSLYKDFFSFIGIPDPTSLFGTVFTVCLVSVLILNFPKKETAVSKDGMGGEGVISSLHLLIKFRLLINGAICLMPVLFYLACLAFYGSY